MKTLIEGIKKIIRIGLLAAAGILAFESICLAQNFGTLANPEPASEAASQNATPQDTATQTSEAQPQEPSAEAILASLPLGDASTYTMGVNDVIEIVVQRHPEVSGQYTINNEGKIQYEFIGDVEVIGKTKDEVKELLAHLVSTYILNPDITVKIVGYNSKAVFVIGEVGAPGKIYMRGDTITIQEALVQAGLPLLSASTHKCRLITPSADGNPGQKYVDIFKLLYEGDLRENLVMKPGDTLYIPATVLAKAMRVISPVTTPVREAGNTARPIVTGGF